GHAAPQVPPGRQPDMETTGTVQYDDSGGLLRIADGSGIAQTFAVDGFGRTIETTDGKGNQFRRGYDSRGRVAWEAAYGGKAPPYGRPVALDSKVPLLSMVEYQYDNLNRPLQIDRWH